MTHIHTAAEPKARRPSCAPPFMRGVIRCGRYTYARYAYARYAYARYACSRYAYARYDCARYAYARYACAFCMDVI